MKITRHDLRVITIPMALNYYETIAHFEKEFLMRALFLCGYKINKTSRITGLNKATLLRRLKEYNIHPGKPAPTPVIESNDWSQKT